MTPVEQFGIAGALLRVAVGVFALVGVGATILAILRAWERAVCAEAKRRTSELEAELGELRELYDGRGRLLVEKDREIAMLRGTPFRTGAGP